MAKNLIPDITKWLGLQMGELFHVVIDGVENKLVSFYFNDHELMYLAFSENEPRLASDRTVIGLIYGGYEVKKLPWIPKFGEEYWCVMPSSDPDYPKTVLVTNTKNSIFHLLNLVHHNYFPSQEECEKHKVEFVKELQAIVKNMYE